MAHYRKLPQRLHSAEPEGAGCILRGFFSQASWQTDSLDSWVPLVLQPREHRVHRNPKACCAWSRLIRHDRYNRCSGGRANSQSWGSWAIETCWAHWHMYIFIFHLALPQTNWSVHSQTFVSTPSPDHCLLMLRPSGSSRCPPAMVL